MQGEAKLLEMKEVECLQGIEGRAPIYEYFQLKKEEEALANTIQKYVLHSPYAAQYITTGRVIVVHNEVRFFASQTQIRFYITVFVL